MEIIATAWHFIAHLDQVLVVWMQQYGSWVYGLLFAIVFCETGLVITPFLPGDSLLFAAGALWASADRSIGALCGTLIAAALCGDNCNYWIGRFAGSRIGQWQHSRWINRRALERTQEFYRKHGGKTVVIARFVPLVRTFSPFVAGIGSMPYPTFLAFSVGGAVLWVVSLVSAGYWFGNIAFVRENFSLVVFAIIAISLVPVAVEVLRERNRGARPQS
jgi:membrane-associated protein